MKPFNLERAIAGEPFQTVSGIKITKWVKCDYNNFYYIVGIVGNDLIRWSISGKTIWDANGDRIYDSNYCLTMLT